MDQALYQAAAAGDVALFNRSVAIHSATSAELEQYLLSQMTIGINDNIIHVAVQNGHEDFICELEMQLPSSVTIALICQTNKKGYNPLHKAATSGYLEIVKILIQSCHKFSKITFDEANACFETRVVVEDDNRPPWTSVTDLVKQTPVRAMVKGHEEVAAYILSQDMETLCNVIDDYGRSPLSVAVEKGYERVALQILTNG